MKLSPDGSFGAIQPDGTWNGMIKELQLENSDIGWNIFAMNYAMN